MIRAIILTLSLLLFACQSNKQDAEKLLAPETFLSAFEASKGLLVDVRTPGEFAEGSIPAAINIDYKASDFESKMNQLDKEKALFLFCRSGGRSAAACSKAEGLGFKKVYDMKGGYLAYSKSK